MIVYTDRHVDHAFVDRFLWWPVRAFDDYAQRPCWAWLRFARVFKDGRVLVSSFWV